MRVAWCVINTEHVTRTTQSGSDFQPVGEPNSRFDADRELITHVHHFALSPDRFLCPDHLRDSGHRRGYAACAAARLPGSAYLGAFGRATGAQHPRCDQPVAGEPITTGNPGPSLGGSQGAGGTAVAPRLQRAGAGRHGGDTGRRADPGSDAPPTARHAALRGPISHSPGPTHALRGRSPRWADASAPGPRPSPHPGPDHSGARPEGAG